jgi:hypothetical protein
MHAQDTLFKKNHERLLGKVLRVDTATVSFRKATMPDGPVYTVAKAELTAIHFQDGHRDTFTNVVAPIPDVQQVKGQMVSTSSTKLSTRQIQERIEVDRTRFYQNNVSLRHREVSAILLEMKNPDINFYLHDSWKRNEISQVTGYSAIPFYSIAGLGFLLESAFQSGNSKGGSKFASPFFLIGIGGLISGATLTYFSSQYKDWSKASYLKAIDVYNDQIL